MNKFLVLIVLFGAGILALNYLKSPRLDKEITKSAKKIVEDKKVLKNGANVIEIRSIFVPDWTLTNDPLSDGSYDRLIYFGPDENRPDNLSWTTYKVDSVEQLNELKIQGDSVEGIVLDLEISGLPTKDLIGRINAGVERIYSQAKDNGLKMALALYGDLFYRQRPYDLRTLNRFSDEVMVMAYDFNKSYGEPGPNFPYENFKKMIDQYLEFIPPEKLTIIFGMYGYDWALKDGKPLKAAEALTLNQIRTKFIGIIKTDPVSKEKNVGYKGKDGYDHEVFFEDEESVEVKIDYLKEKGIGSIAYWAWGYF